MDYTTAKKTFSKVQWLSFTKKIDKRWLSMRSFRFIYKNCISDTWYRKLYLRIPVWLAHYLHDKFSWPKRPNFSVHNLFTGIVWDWSQEWQLPLYDIDIYEWDIKQNHLYHYIRYVKWWWYMIDPLWVIQRELHNPNESVYTFFRDFCDIKNYWNDYYDYLVTPAMIHIFWELEDDIKKYISSSYSDKNKRFNMLPEIVDNARYFIKNRQYQKILKNKRMDCKKIIELPIAI